MTTETEVTQLLRLVQNGDAAAFAEISRLYAGMEGAVSRFAVALARGDWTRIQRSLDPDSSEPERFRQLWDNPQSDEERRRKRCLESLGTPVMVDEITPSEDGLKVKWRATATKPLILTKDGVSKTWHPGDKFELESLLKEVNGEWKIVRF